MCDVNPIFHKARPVPFAIRPAVTEALDKMVAKGYLCEVASSKWATPVVVVPKKNKEIRICCDFKVTLNKYLDTAAYPLPTQQDLFSTLAKGKYFSKLDLRNAYLQLEVDPGTRPLLTINTHKGLFRFKRMPFGLANAPSYFQSVMDRVLSGIGGVICYIDDVLIATASIEEHLALLKTIFARLAKYNIKLKKEKCLFLQKEIEYLGHLVTGEGIRPLDHKVQAIQKAKTPTNISELRSFLGLVNFYGKLIPNLPELLKPLHELLHKKRPWVWTKECGEAIDKCKNSITSERVLVPYDTTLPLCLATDASQIGVGAVLSHIIEGQERPIMFASRTLSEAEQNYSQIEKEALAIIYGVTKKGKKMANYIQVAAPEGFNFGKPNEWPIWFKRFQRYRIASELSEKSESEQVNALIYIMGDKAEEILILFNLSEAQINDYKLVVSKFQDYFIGKRNVIYERAKFNRRSQGETEPVEEFITNLYVLAETCSYGILKEEMIRDRLVVGVKNLNLSEKLQLESELTLEKAIQIVRQSESVKNQQKEIRQDTEDRNVDVIDRKGSRNGTNVRKTRMKGTKTYNSNFPKNPQGCSSYEKRKCFRCGYYQGHSKEQCPAKDAICNKCRKKGHFAKVCHTKTVQEVSSSQNDVFIGIVEIVQKTQDHGNADLLSRFPVGCEEIPRLNNVYALSFVEELPITAEEIAMETEKDEVLSLAKFYTQQGWPEKVADHLRPYFQRKLELTVDGECLVWGMRVVIPPSLRIKMLNCLHETHSGMNKMKAVARSHFWWPNLDTQIEFLVKRCRSCQQSQDGPNKGKWQPWKWSTRPWQRIHIDFANMENINLLIVVDSHSKWIEAIPMRETTTRKTIEQLRTPHVTTGKTPSELFIGRALRTRVSLIHPSLASRVRDQQARQMRYDRRTHLEEFQIDDLVWCKNFRGGDKWIPGKIVGKKGTRVYTILIHGQVKAYHRDQIRKRWRNGEEDESGDGERQPEHSRGAGPSAIISEVVRD
ncbi:K02A2.6-like, partial [Cordylochernes scorpioides]